MNSLILYFYAKPLRLVPSRQGGFTMVQVLVSIVIIGILGSMGFGKLSAFLKQKSLQGEIQSLAALVRQSRSTGIKKNIQVGLIFDAAMQRCRIFEDVNGNGGWNTGEPIRDATFGRGINVGLPAKNPPISGPVGGTIPTTGLEGTWTAALLFAKDPMATPSVGAVYFRSQNLDAWTGCLVRSSTSQQIQAFLWNGASWRLL